MKYITLNDITIDKNNYKMVVIPKGTVLTQWRDSGMYESRNPTVTIGINWIENNLHIFKEII